MSIEDTPGLFLRRKLEKLAKDMGFDDPQDYLAETISFNSGICINPGCDYTTDECESGTEDDWCESCETNTIVSGLALDTHTLD